MASLIDPRIARAVARRIAGSTPLTDSHHVDALRRDLDAAVPHAEELVAAASGIRPPPPVRWGLIDRFTWAKTNIAGMDELLEPLAERLNPRLEALPVALRVAQRSVLSAEIGGLLGYVSRRVLGQYDLLVPENLAATAPAGSARRANTAVADGAALYFVAPNMIETERRLGFVPRDFALWVSLHEVTHRFQFAGVEWLRPRFFGLVGSYLETIDLDARGLVRRFATAARRLASRSTPPEERNPIYLLASEAQRATLDQIQALMSVVEGHGNFVMDAVGARVIPSFARMRAAFRRRREQAGAIQRAMNHAIGLEMKLRQYELGQRFCEEVARSAGRDGIARLWAGPENLPSLTELRSPDLWLERCG